MRISAIGRMGRGPEKDLFQDYMSRLGWPWQLVELDSRQSDPKRKQTEESEKLLAACPPGSFRVALDETGRQLSSRNFANSLSGWMDEGYTDICFLIGGADGHTQTLRGNCQFLLSLGQMTWPHMLARVMLAEQLWRAQAILRKHPYHRD